MRKLRKGDDVIVIAGKDKGKRGSITKLIENNLVIIQGVGTVKKHQKPNPNTGSVGGIINQDMPIHISNVAIYNFESKKKDRVGFKYDQNENKVRIYRSSGELIES